MASKYNVMEDVQAAVDDEGLKELIGAVEPIFESLKSAEEAREEAYDSVSEAMDWHEERDWDSRNSALENAIDALQRYSDNLTSFINDVSEIDGNAPPASKIDDIDNAKSKLEDIL